MGVDAGWGSRFVRLPHRRRLITEEKSPLGKTSRRSAMITFRRIHLGDAPRDRRAQQWPAPPAEVRVAVAHSSASGSSRWSRAAYSSRSSRSGSSANGSRSRTQSGSATVDVPGYLDALPDTGSSGLGRYLLSQGPTTAGDPRVPLQRQGHRQFFPEIPRPSPSTTGRASARLASTSRWSQEGVRHGPCGSFPPGSHNAPTAGTGDWGEAASSG
jgi:hypothetical protein